MRALKKSITNKTENEIIIPDDRTKELGGEKVITNVTSTEGQASVWISLLSCWQCYLTVFYHLIPNKQKYIASVHC